MTHPARALTFRHTGPDETLTLRGHILRVYEASHADQLHNPWFSPDKFWERLVDIYIQTPAFDLVTGWQGTEVVGYAFGSSRLTDNPWDDILAHFPHMTGGQAVYIFREFAVDPAVQRNGYGHAIHNELLANRPEQVAQLLVRPDNVPARTAYSKWGWIQIGTKQPFPDSPTFDMLALDLTSR